MHPHQGELVLKLGPHCVGFDLLPKPPRMVINHLIEIGGTWLWMRRGVEARVPPSLRRRIKCLQIWELTNIANY